jgi:tight adherence protein B
MNAAGGFCLAAAGFIVALPPDPIRQRLLWLGSGRLKSDRGLSPRDGSTIGQRLALCAVNPWLVAMIAGLLGGILIGIVPGSLAACSGWVLARCWAAISAERDAERGRGEFSTAVAALSDEYASGATTHAAFSSAAGMAGRYERVFEAAAAGASAGVDVSPLFFAEPELARLGLACHVAREIGTALTSVLAGLRADLEADRATRRAVHAAVAGPRTSAMLLALLPAVGLAMGTAMGASPARILLHSPIGLAALSLGVAFDLAGLVWTLALTTRALP